MIRLTPEVHDREIVECVMNVSEGRDAEKLQAIASAIEAVADCRLLSYVADFDHNRAVFSSIGTISSVSTAAFEAIQKGMELIDLREHRGVHPRLGAVDVVPFVPLRNATMDDCVEIARHLGSKVASELDLPVYLYEYAALRPERRNLSEIRKGEFEQLLRQIETDPLRRPDFGPLRVHPSAGAVTIGARDLLIAFNIFLGTTDLAIARQIARSVRERDGGLPGIRALGLYLPMRNQAQVSTNVTRYHETSLLQVLERVNQEAARLGVEATSSEIVGLVPRDALPESAEAKLKLETFHPAQVLEDRIAEVLLRKS